MSITFYARGTRPSATPEEASLNLANGNACRMLALAGLPVDCCGDCPVADLPAVAQRLIAALNARTVYTRPTTTDAQPGRCTVIECGTDEDMERSRIHRLLRVVALCIAAGCDLAWD